MLRGQVWDAVWLEVGCGRAKAGCGHMQDVAWLSCFLAYLPPSRSWVRILAQRSVGIFVLIISNENCAFWYANARMKYCVLTLVINAQFF